MARIAVVRKAGGNNRGFFGVCFPVPIVVLFGDFQCSIKSNPVNAFLQSRYRNLAILHIPFTRYSMTIPNFAVPSTDHPRTTAMNNSDTSIPPTSETTAHAGKGVAFEFIDGIAKKVSILAVTSRIA